MKTVEKFILFLKKCNLLGLNYNHVKIFVYNLFIFLFIYLLLEISAFAINAYKYKNVLKYEINTPKEYISYFFMKNTFDKNRYDENYRKPNLIYNSKNLPIIIFGCSFAEGHGLDDEDTFSGQLSSLLNTTTYNRANGGMGPQLMLYELKTKKIKKISKDCSLIFFVNIEDSKYRSLMHRNWPFLNKMNVKYKLQKEKLVLLNYPDFILNSHIYRLLEDSIRDNEKDSIPNATIFAIFKESFIESTKLYPNSQFIILNYDKKHIPYENQLRKIGIHVINFDDIGISSELIFSQKYQLSATDTHPNAKAWKYITPKIIKKLKNEKLIN